MGAGSRPVNAAPARPVTRHGNRWLVRALGSAAMAAARTKDTAYLGARYQRLAHQLGEKKALVAVEHSILIAVWALSR
jgi:transposase